MPTLHPPSSTVRVEVREASVDRYLAQGWRKADASAPKPTEPEPSSYACDVCGFVAKTAAGLGSHRRSHQEG